jgi:hypothetical protein
MYQEIEELTLNLGVYFKIVTRSVTNFLVQTACRPSPDIHSTNRYLHFDKVINSIHYPGKHTTLIFAIMMFIVPNIFQQ